METLKNGFLSTVFSALLRPILRHLDKASLPKYRGTCPLPGLGEEVKVRWQSHGIPHVFANNETDLFLAQGYLHAQERLWQMEMSRKFLTGRLAEIFGNFPVPWKESTSHFRGRETVDFDYFMRLIGMRDASVASLMLLSEEERRKLDAYSDGVNRYIEGCGRKLPWEFRVLRYQPEPWRPEDSLTIGKGFAFLLSTALFTRLNMIALAAKLNDQPEKLRSLFPSYPKTGRQLRVPCGLTRGIWQFTNALSPARRALQVTQQQLGCRAESISNGNALSAMIPFAYDASSHVVFDALEIEPNPTEPDGHEVGELPFRDTVRVFRYNR
jgi:acyl-homoserine lactone acylase PvdQ